MDNLSEDVLVIILGYVKNRSDMRSCAQVSKRWLRAEGLSRRCLRVMRPELLPKFIDRFPYLTSVDIKGAVHDEDLILLEKCKQIESVELSFKLKQEVCQASPPYFVPCSLWEKGMDDDRLTDEGLSFLSQAVPTLTQLDLRGRTHVGSVGFSWLALRCNLLCDLDLGYCKGVNDVSLKSLAQCKGLKRLVLSCCMGVTSVGLCHLASGPCHESLQQLCVSGCLHIKDEGVLALLSCQKLTSVSFSNCRSISDASISPLALTLPLKDVKLNSTAISDESFISLSKNGQNLQSISASFCAHVSDVGVSALASCSQLKFLDLGCCFEVVGDCLPLLAASCIHLEFLVLFQRLELWTPAEVIDTLEQRGCRIMWS